MFAASALRQLNPPPARTAVAWSHLPSSPPFLPPRTCSAYGPPPPIPPRTCSAYGPPPPIPPRTCSVYGPPPPVPPKYGPPPPIPPRTCSQPPPIPRKKNASRRKCEKPVIAVLEELSTKQAGLVQDMAYVKDKYIRGLRESKILSNGEHKIIFRNWDQLLEVHSQFSQGIQIRGENKVVSV